MNKQINTVHYSDDIREMYVQYLDGKFYVLNQDKEKLEEYAVEYSFEAFIRSFNVMESFFKELALNNKEVRLKLAETSKKDKSNTKIKYFYA